MKTQKNPLKIALALIGLALVTSVQVSRAIPYASGISVAGNTVSYYLNEDADDVKVVLTSPNSTLSLGAQTKGLQSFSKGTSTAWQIQVTKSKPPVPYLISAD